MFNGYQIRIIVGKGAHRRDKEGAEGGGDESALLTAPARREDRPGAAQDRLPRRPDGRRAGGPTRRHLRSLVAPEVPTGRAEQRRVGHSIGRVGVPDLRALVSLEENDGSIYNRDEALLIENTHNIRRLIDQLESKEEEAQQDEAQQET